MSWVGLGKKVTDVYRCRADETLSSPVEDNCVSVVVQQRAVADESRTRHSWVPSSELHGDTPTRRHRRVSTGRPTDRLSCDDSGAPMTAPECGRGPGGATTAAAAEPGPSHGARLGLRGLDCRRRLIRTGLPASVRPPPRSRDNPTRRMEMNWK